MTVKWLEEWFATAWPWLLDLVAVAGIALVILRTVVWILTRSD
jgi:hypothetical protein